MNKNFPLLILSVLVVIGCSNLDKIATGKLVNHLDGKITRLSEVQVEELNELIIQGTKKIFEGKWQVGNHILAKDSEGNDIIIYSYADRYFCIKNAFLCYEVIPEYLAKFKDVFGTNTIE